MKVKSKATFLGLNSRVSSKDNKTYYNVRIDDGESEFNLSTQNPERFQGLKKYQEYDFDIYVGLYRGGIYLRAMDAFSPAVGK